MTDFLLLHTLGLIDVLQPAHLLWSHYSCLSPGPHFLSTRGAKATALLTYLVCPLLNALLHRAPQLLSALSSFKLPQWVHRNQSVHAPWLTAQPLHAGPEAPSQPRPPAPSALDNTSQWLSPTHAVWLSIFAKLTFFFCWNVPSFTLTHPPGCSWGITSISRTAFLHALPVPRGLGAGLLSALLQLCPCDLPSAQLPLK